jgi:4-amino-4-deoxy-L-arabinose transferase-like glycosyltransferase
VSPVARRLLRRGGEGRGSRLPETEAPAWTAPKNGHSGVADRSILVRRPPGRPGAAWERAARALSSARALALSEAIGVAVVAAVLRLDGIQRFGFNSDEAVYAGQAAAIAGFQPYAQLFGVFRAHPLLVHFILALGYEITGVNDWLPRLIAAGFGVALAVLCWATARLLHGRPAGVGAGLLVALSPYAVIVSRQVLLDGPMATLVALTLLLAAAWLTTGRVAWLYAAATSAGLAFLAKEMAVLLVPGAIVFIALSRSLPLSWRRDVPRVALIYAATVAPYPLSLAFGGGNRTTGNFLTWQLLRQPNHDAAFYPGVLPVFGWPMLAAAVIGAAALWRRRHPMAVLSVCLVVCNLAFFEAWPTKGFEYLMPVVPPLAYLAGLGVAELAPTWRAVTGWRRLRALWRPTGARWAPLGARWAPLRVRWTPVVVAGAVSLVAGVLLASAQNAVATPSAHIATDSDSPQIPTVATGALAGTGGLEAARPTGQWVRTHTLGTAEFITVGPSFANVIAFYGQRRALALSVSPNPLRRNPTYEAISNPDATIRSGAIQYLVYDSYSAARAPFFARKLLTYARKFSGAAVYEYRPGDVGPPAVVIYEVHP